MNSNTTSSCENSPIFNTTRNYTITTCASISGASFIIYIPLLIVHLANIRKMTFISSFNFQMLLSSILHSVTFFVRHFNQYLFRCGTKGPLNMIAILLSVGIATNLSYVSFNTLWNVKLTTSPPTYMKTILLIFGLIVPITFPLLLIALRAIFDRDTQMKDVKCWNESNTLQHMPPLTQFQSGMQMGKYMFRQPRLTTITRQARRMWMLRSVSFCICTKLVLSTPSTQAPLLASGAIWSTDRPQRSPH